MGIGESYEEWKRSEVAIASEGPRPALDIAVFNCVLLRLVVVNGSQLGILSSTRGIGVAPQNAVMRRRTTGVVAIYDGAAVTSCAVRTEGAVVQRRITGLGKEPAATADDRRL